MINKALTFALALAGASAVTRPARADGPPAGDAAATAKDHYDRAMIAYNIQDWPSAIRELRAAYEADPKPDYLFALGQAQRLSGDCAAAVMSFHSYLRQATAKQAEATETLIHECDAKPEPKKDAIDVTPKPPPGGRPPPPPPPAPRPHHWYGDVLGDVLLVGGVAGLGVGAGFLITGNSDMSNAVNATNIGVYGKHVSSAKTEQQIGVAALAGGGVLAALALVRYVLAAPSGTEHATLDVAPVPGGAAFAIGGRF
jgi:hypothetical protein